MNFFINFIFGKGSKYPLDYLKMFKYNLSPFMGINIPPRLTPPIWSISTLKLTPFFIKKIYYYYYYLLCVNFLLDKLGNKPFNCLDPLRPIPIPTTPNPIKDPWIDRSFFLPLTLIIAFSSSLFSSLTISILISINDKFSSSTLTVRQQWLWTSWL